jgi:hypothetical protein
MPRKTSQSQLSQNYRFELTGTPAYFVVPDSWPWDVTVLELPALLHAIDVPYDRCEELRRLLFGLSDVIFRDNLGLDVDLRSIKLGKRSTGRERGLIERLAKLPPMERLRCCGENRVNVRLVDGRPLFLDAHNEGELLFGKDPVDWIRNGLWALSWKFRGRPRSENAKRGILLPCPAFVIHPCATPAGREITTTTVPALYVGTRSANTEIAEWREGFWFRDIADGYALSGQDLQAYWVKRVPGTSKPDPVYRFGDSGFWVDGITGLTGALPQPPGFCEA